MVFLTKEVWDTCKHAGPSGLGDLDVMEYIARIYRRPLEQEDDACPPGNDRSKDSCLSNRPLHSSIVLLFSLANCIFTSNQVPLHVHVVFAIIFVFPVHACTVYTSGARHDALSIPSN